MLCGQFVAFIGNTNVGTTTVTARIWCCKDESGEPMIGASILDTSTKQGTIADMDGKFSLEVTPSSKLHISFVGYKDQVISGKALKRI